MKILGIIPARGGSKGVPGKNIKLLNGKPLLQYTSDVALKSTLLDKVILSSDDDEIIRVAKKLGISVPFKRPSDLATDGSPTLPVIIHALEFLKTELNEEYDAVCLLQVTSPLRTVDFLNKAITTFIDSNSESLISVRLVPDEFNPHWVFTENEKGRLQISTGDKSIVTRRQELPKSYHRDGSIYITKVSTILSKKSLYGDSIAFIESEESTLINIDTMKDWSIAEENITKND